MASSSRPEPVSRRERPAKPALSRRAIVAAALTLMREGGEGMLTMRRLAAELDTGAASLYVYFRNTDELYAAVLDELLGTIDLRRGRGAWRDRLLSLLISYTEILTAHPALARTALVTRSVGANSLNLWEALLALLDEGDIAHTGAAWAVDLLLQRATATAAEQGARLRAAGAAAEDERVAEAVASLSPDTHPQLAAVSEQLLSGTPMGRLIWGFEVLINGIADTPRVDTSTRQDSEGRQ